MRVAGLILFVLSFLWLILDLRLGFVHHQYTRTIWQMQHLPAGELVSRSKASEALAELGDALRVRQQKALLPACLTLAGGLLFGFAPRRFSNDAKVT